MKSLVGKLLQKILSKFKLRLISDFEFKKLLIARNESAKNKIISILSQTFEFEKTILSESKSQIGQDLLALLFNNQKRDGFFVEFGATNGKDLSNTYLLEKLYGWRGILAEPSKFFHAELSSNRNCCIVTKCVWSASGELLEFNERKNEEELSKLASNQNPTIKNFLKKKNSFYKVETISLLDLLHQNDAPNVIDFLSIDTEGSEFEILNNFTFTSHIFNVICVEHNYTENREKIEKLLSRQGYIRVFAELSEFDDWYIHNSRQNKMAIN